ncbi:hypothetical protein B0E55_02925 [Rhodococcus sp. 66b]|nr:hypothetical protein B0E55_02925 [Rhodococcus sp. 66b]
MTSLRTRRTQDFDQPLERHIGMPVGRQARFPYPSEQLFESFVRIDLGAKHQGVHEHADHVIERLIASPADRGTDRDVGGTTEPAQQRCICRLQHHEQRDAPRARQLVQLARRAFADLKMVLGTVIGRDGRTRSVGRQIQLIRQIGKCPAPEVDLARRLRARVFVGSQCFALPQGVVGVLDRQRRPRRRRLLTSRRVCDEKVTCERTERQSVCSDVMENHHQDVVRRRHLEEGNPYRDFERHVEAARRHVEQRRVEMRIPNLDRIQLHRGPVDRQNQLLRGSVDIRVDRPQGLVSLEKIHHRGMQGGRVHRTGEPDRERKVVRGRRRIETVDEPHALLCKRERDNLGTRLGDQRGELPGVTRHRLGAGRQGSDRGGLEKLSNAELHSQGGTHAGHQLCCNQRVSTEFEEVVVDTDALDTENVGKDVSDNPLDFGAGLAVLLRTREHRLGQPGTIQFATRVERQRIEHHQRGRNHVRREASTGELTEHSSIDVSARARHDVADQLITGRGDGHQDNSLGNVGVCQKDGLDFAELDALSTELHLEVGTPDVVEVSVLTAADEVAGPVHTLTGRAVRIGYEPIRAQVRSTNVSARELNAGEIELTRLPDGGRAKLSVQYVRLSVPLRHTDRHGSSIRGHGLVVRDRHRGFGRTVQVVQSGSTEFAEGGRRLGRERLADDEHVAQRITRSGRCIRSEQREHGWHEVGDRDAELRDLVRHVDRVSMTVRSRDDERGADLQRHEETPQRHVERRSGLLQVDVRRRKLVLGVHPLKLIVDRRVSDRDTLGSTGRT